MTPPRESFDVQVLLSHVAWVQALARDLVPADPHRAEDLAQEACLAALRHRPGTDRPLSSWLASVVRNLVSQGRRREARSRSREEDAARAEAEPSALDVVEKVAAHREVVEAVMELEEPYRTTILLRFYEGLPPSAIARERGVPLATVKARLARGLERLRVRLDRGHGGDGRSWLLALIPLVRSPGGTTATTVGTLLVGTNLKIAIAAAAALCGVAFLWSSSRTGEAAPASPVVAEASPRPEEEPAPGEKLVIPAAPAGRVAEVPAPNPAPAAVPTPAVEPLATVHGRVLDLRARPLSGVRIWFRKGTSLVSSKEFSVTIEDPAPDAPAAVSEPNGTFEIPIPAVAGSILSADPRLATVLAGLCGPTPTKSEAIVIVAPRLELAGRVIAEDGRPLADARVSLLLPEHFRKRFPEVLDASEERGWFARTDAAGLFELPDAPQIEGAKLQASLEGWLGRRESAPQTSTRGIEIVMLRPRAEPGSVSGQVVDEDGRLVAGARISLGTSGATSDEQGAFTLRVPEGGTKAPWMAVKPGHLPAIETASAALQAGQADGSEFVVLELGPPPRTIEGRVVDTDLQPVAGAKVWPAEPTFFGMVEEMPAHLEGLLAGSATRSDIEKILSSLGPETDPMAVLSRTPSAFWPFVMTDAAGAFRLEGLLDREYRIAVMDPDTLLRVESGPVLAGRRNIEIRLDVSSVWERVAGKVVSGDGAPVPGVSIVATCDVISVQESEGSRSTFHTQGKTTVTDSEGRFVLPKVPKERVYLRVDGEDILPIEYGRGDPQGIAGPSRGKVEELVLQVRLRYHLQVEMPASEAGSADEVKIIDGKGEPVVINVFLGNSRRSTDSVELKDGKSDVLVVPDDAQTLLLLRQGVEVRRVTLHLVPRQLNLVRP